MKHLYLIVIIILSAVTSTTAQKLNEYKATNGINYMVGDTITLGVGSSCDGFFNTIYSGAFATKLMNLVEESDYDPRLPSGYEGSKLEIRKMKQNDGKTLFTITTEDYGNFLIDIEAAIASCEVAFCQAEGFLSQEQFEKLVLLYQACLNGEIENEKFESLRREMILR